MKPRFQSESWCCLTMTLGRSPYLCALWTPHLRTRRGRAGGRDFLLVVTFDGSGSSESMGMTAQFPLADGHAAVTIRSVLLHRTHTPP